MQIKQNNVQMYNYNIHS